MAQKIVQKSKSSTEYWRKREEENLKKNLLTEEEYVQHIHDILDYTADQIQREINGFYTKYARQEGISLAEAKRRIKSADVEEFARKAKKYVKEKNFSKQANEEMRLYNATMKINRLELLKANIGLELVSGFDELQKYNEEILTDRTKEELERQAGILGGTVQNNEKMVSSIVSGSFHNATYSERIWLYQDMMRNELDKLLRQGLIQGKNPRQLATHLQKLFGTCKYVAERLMRTELARVQIDAQKQSFEKNGYEQYTFLSLGSACGSCRALNGKHFDVSKMMPGDNAPPIHPNCRCSVSAYIDDDNYNEWLDTYKEHGLSYEEWKNQKPVRNLAKAIDSMYSISEEGTETYTREEIIEEMQKSPIGQKVIEWIENSSVKIAIYEDEFGYGERGYQEGNRIVLYPKNIHSLRVAAQTLIHEMGHYHYGIGNCQHAEAICFGLEKLHLTGKEKLTKEEWEYVKKLAIDNYTRLGWEDGGYGDYSEIRLYD